MKQDVQHTNTASAPCTASTPRDFAGASLDASQDSVGVSSETFRNPASTSIEVPQGSVHSSTKKHVSHTYLLKLAEKLIQTHSLSVDEYEALITFYDAEVGNLLTREARRIRESVYGTSVYIRGLIEISNYCKSDCLYCGIRKSNTSCTRYRLAPEDILECAQAGYQLGFRTFVLQGGEDPWFTDDRLVDLLHALKAAHPDCAITLSLGERSSESYQRLFDAGADRYSLRH